MTLTTLLRCPAAETGDGAADEPATRSDTHGDTGPGAGAESGVAAGPRSGGRGSSDARGSRERDADALAVASFVLGLVGLLVMNILLGPAAIVMAALALGRSTTRRGRALLGLVLGIADLVVLAVLFTASGTVSWNFAG
ncbi:DUF4190 domain-containing protein [Streptomyces sp. NPDC056061]|uniref:DUF4190 domain-containing protein n=1 Tax=Streptomyces sp. NPDC056061 TaxID=3345700 RepID=UPI0035DE5F19